MGIDAEMFARIKGRDNWLNPEDELRAAYELASTIGPGAFIITKGSEYACGDEHHALSIVRPIRDAEEAEYYGVAEAYVGKTVWTQDGPDIVAEEDEQFVKVHLMSRYYGEDYARGHWPTIRAVAEWLEWRFPQCEVWYGGDSSGVCATLLNEVRRKQLNDFYLASGHKSYTRSPGWNFSGHKAPVCPCCETELLATGGGGGDSFWHCDGCGRNAVVRASGNATFGREDAFKLAEKARSDG